MEEGGGLDGGGLDGGGGGAGWGGVSKENQQRRKISSRRMNYIIASTRKPTAVICGWAMGGFLH